VSPSHQPGPVDQESTAPAPAVAGPCGVNSTSTWPTWIDLAAVVADEFRPAGPVVRLHPRHLVRPGQWVTGHLAPPFLDAAVA